MTICTQNRACLFGEVVNGEMRLNEAGRWVQTVWRGLPDHYANAELDAWVVMPNHVHGVVVLADPGPVVPAAGADGMLAGAGLKPAPKTPATVAGAVAAPPASTTTAKRHALSEIVRAFKTFSARQVNAWRRTPGISVWQRNYYEHILRDHASLTRIRRYIADNPGRWAMDPENPQRAAEATDRRSDRDDSLDWPFRELTPE